MEREFKYNGVDYVLYQENGQKVYVNGTLCGEWVLRELTDSGREWAGSFHVPAWKRGQKLIDHVKNAIDQRGARAA